MNALNKKMVHKWSQKVENLEMMEGKKHRTSCKHFTIRDHTLCIIDIQLIYYTYLVSYIDPACWWVILWIGKLWCPMPTKIVKFLMTISPRAAVARALGSVSARTLGYFESSQPSTSEFMQPSQDLQTTRLAIWGFSSQSSFWTEIRYRAGVGA